MDASGLKKEVVVVPTWQGSRDAGKTFMITEWPAARTERWALYMVLCVKGTTAQVPEMYEQMGMIGVARRGLNAFLAADVDPARLADLLDELLECVTLIRDPRATDKTTGQQIATPIISPTDIMDVKTRYWLRSEVIRVHTNFSPADALWALAKAAMETSPVSPTT